MLYNNIPLETPADKNEVEVEMKEETIKGGDGQDMKVYVYRRKGSSGKLPGVVYTHGGGMVLVPTMNPVHDRWCRSLAAQGMVVIMTDFRNAYTAEKYNHFPAGLNDCVAALKWVVANKDSLGIRNIVLTGLEVAAWFLGGFLLEQSSFPSQPSAAAVGLGLLLFGLYRLFRLFRPKHADVFA